MTGQGLEALIPSRKGDSGAGSGAPRIPADVPENIPVFAPETPSLIISSSTSPISVPRASEEHRQEPAVLARYVPSNVEAVRQDSPQAVRPPTGGSPQAI